MHQGGTPISAHFFGRSALARHALIDERSLVKVDPGAPLETLAPLGCGIQTGTGGITEGSSKPESFIPTLVDLHAQGKLPLERLIRHYPFEEIERAAADASSGHTIKPVLVFD